MNYRRHKRKRKADPLSIPKGPKRGDYFVEVQKKGKNEACIDGITEGDTFFTVGLRDGGFFDTLSQEAAEILSHLVRLEMILARHEPWTGSSPLPFPSTVQPTTSFPAPPYLTSRELRRKKNLLKRKIKRGKGKLVRLHL